MGLSCSHNAFDGTYSAFNRFRNIICYACNGSYSDHQDKNLNPNRFYLGNDFTESKYPGLYELLRHSDCSGIIRPNRCKIVAQDLSKIKQSVKNLKIDENFIFLNKTNSQVLQDFIDGCLVAFYNSENLEFH